MTIEKFSFMLQIEIEMLNNLIAKVRETLPQLDPGPELDLVEKHFHNTLEHFRNRQESPESEGFRYDGLVL